MEITEVKIFLKESADRKLKAFATVTFDNVFVVRNIKIIEGSKGLFVAMPSRKMKEACPKCAFKNAVRSRFCNQCGAAIETSAQPVVRMVDDASKAARQSEHRDIAHPITSEFRDYIQKKVTETYEKERQSPRPASDYKTRSASGAEVPEFEEEIE